MDERSNYHNKKDLSYGLLRNYIFNENDNSKQTLARTKYIYVDLAQKKELYNEKEYINFHEDFKQKYGYTILEYLSIIFAVIGMYNSSTHWRLNIDNLFSDTQITEKGKKIINDISINLEDIREWAKNNKKSIWNYFKYHEFPLLKITSNEVIPFMPKILYELLFKSLFHKIRHCYGKDNKKFIDFFGRPFEEYGYKIIEKAVELSFLDYKLIKDFRYGKDNSKKSPDVILVLENKMLVIEMKSREFQLETILGEMKGDKDPVFDDLAKMVIDPLKQAHDRMQEIIDKDIKNLASIEEIYLMSVTIDSFPKLPYFNEIMDEKLQNHFSIPIKSYYQMDINSFEHLCYLIARPKRKGKPVFHYLNLRDRYKNLSFINFLKETSQPVRNLDIIDKKTKEIFDEFKVILFGPEE